MGSGKVHRLTAEEYARVQQGPVMLSICEAASGPYKYVGELVADVMEETCEVLEFYGSNDRAALITTAFKDAPRLLGRAEVRAAADPDDDYDDDDSDIEDSELEHTDLGEPVASAPPRPVPKHRTTVNGAPVRPAAFPHDLNRAVPKVIHRPGEPSTMRLNRRPKSKPGDYWTCPPDRWANEVEAPLARGGVVTVEMYDADRRLAYRMTLRADGRQYDFVEWVPLGDGGLPYYRIDADHAAAEGAATRLR